ncbi:hypothetical protein [Sulfurimonas hydrogeniphila]|uniref:hypothetical protein n=1 Tax=Sulfurimonas hydrogeniphila TaxID=2509341 RepID=UPI00125EAB41|nr:hypothetical protein [Sulfurimonas hydrogeniphila]
MERKLIVSFAIAGTLMLVGCSSGPQINPSIRHIVDPNGPGTVIRDPKLNKITTAEIGQNMYSKSYLINPTTQKVILEGVAKGSRYGISIDSSETLPVTSLGVKVTKTLYPYDSWHLLRNVEGKNAMCYSPYDCLIDMNNDNTFTYLTTQGSKDFVKLDQSTKYKLEKSKPIYTEDSFKYVALYQGKKGNLIKISFREFKDNMARPAFTQDIEYELEKDGKTIIGFKGLRIKVLKATNMNITYKVIKDYN